MVSLHVICSLPPPSPPQSKILAKPVLQFIAPPHSILSYNLCFGPFMLLQWNKQQRMIFEKELDIKNLIWMIKSYFKNFFEIQLNSTQNLLRPTHLHLNNTNHISIHG